jgi:hypothetical protein
MAAAPNPQWAIMTRRGNDPSQSLRAVTPNDNADLPQVNGLYPRSLWVGGAGDVAVVGVEDDPAGGAVTLKAVPAGTTLPDSVRRVMSTNTTATFIVARY